MKKILSIAAAAILAGCANMPPPVSYPAPAAPEGYALIDAYGVGRPKDYVKFHNSTDLDQIKAKVMYHNPKSMKWEPFGNVSLKGTGDTDTMSDSTRFGGGLRYLRYFAVKFADGKAHKVSLDGVHNDLHVYVEQ